MTPIRFSSVLILVFAWAFTGCPYRDGWVAAAWFNQPLQTPDVVLAYARNHAAERQCVGRTERAIRDIRRIARPIPPKTYDSP